MTEFSVLLADRKSASLTKLAKALTKGALDVKVAHDADEALKLQQDGHFDVVVYGGGLGGRKPFALAESLKKLDPTQSVVVLLTKSTPKSLAAAEEAGADSVMVRPIQADALAAVVRASGQVARLRRAVQLHQSIEPVMPFHDPTTGFYMLERFKEALYIEVKRARRYKLPLSMLMCSIESVPSAVDPEMERELMGGLATAVRQSMRDTDFPVNQGDKQVLLLLPHTDLKGAHVVARRILFRIARSQVKRGDVAFEPRVSLGYAAASGDALQFAELVREATANLHAAQERGGNCLVPPKP